MTPPLQVIPGWVGTDNTIGGPGGTPMNPNVLQAASATAAVTRVRVAAPAAANDWQLPLPTSGTFNTGYGSITCPNGIWARLIFGFCTLSTSISAGNRRTGLRILDGNNKLLAHLLGGATIGPSLTAKIGYTRSSDFLTIIGPNADGLRTLVVKLHGGVILQPGDTIQSYSNGLLAGDHYSAVELVLQTWTAVPTYEGLGPILS